MSASSATSAGVEHQVAPRSTSGSALCLVRLVTFTLKPASMRWLHMWAPIIPVPTQPIVEMSFGLCGGNLVPLPCVCPCRWLCLWSQPWSCLWSRPWRRLCSCFRQAPSSGVVKFGCEFLGCELDEGHSVSDHFVVQPGARC